MTTQDLALELRFDKNHALHHHVIALYSSIIELTGSYLALVDRKLISGVPILLRSVLEAYVDLINLIRDPKYGYQLQVGYLREWLKVLHEARTGTNDYLADITKAPSLDKTIAT